MQATLNRLRRPYLYIYAYICVCAPIIKKRDQFRGSKNMENVERWAYRQGEEQKQKKK